MQNLIRSNNKCPALKGWTFVLVIRLIVPAGNDYRVDYNVGTRYYVDIFDLCQLAAGQAEQGQQYDQDAYECFSFHNLIFCSF